ncbi:MAG: type II toxin-antitoxin system RelE/ParE family toxin [Prolixibacteraceae bacterium]|jgi:proteic killer suppression protein|nr:type II toxin-antitoxin system RelE/ParE family toxin [Prolixibacteraceae bacterium]
MIVTFEKEYLRDLYETGKTTDKKHRFQPDVIEGYVKGIYYLEKASNPEDLYRYRSLNYEKLKGYKKGISSIRATKKYRIEFIEKNEGNEPVFTVCNILELSNHYK